MSIFVTIVPYSGMQKISKQYWWTKTNPAPAGNMACIDEMCVGEKCSSDLDCDPSMGCIQGKCLNQVEVIPAEKPTKTSGFNLRSGSGSKPKSKKVNSACKKDSECPKTTTCASINNSTK